ncbi:MAG: 3-hydroxyacyl-CoA dehydrogenase NAD-binding domain-containing protein [Actinomycetota bacterium]|nr:3-hydroxyacyl-CoA dehydrogenase NAD-binding domain-containing protein [Actinomycetota bacterium]
MTEAVANSRRGEATPGVVGLIGGGVIGCGWAARFLLAGADVLLYDPDPETERKLVEVLNNARKAVHALTDAPLPAEGSWSIAHTVAEAVEDAQFIQESISEREELKISVLNEISKSAPTDALIASSTSGLLPTRLQVAMVHPERFLVGHPFNPVYLLPLVEVCGGSQTSQNSIDQAIAIYSALGMYPLYVRKEIDGFIADRLLEALWRESLWLVAEGTATVSEIDDAIRFGAGLRFAAMGTMLTYRIAGGEGGMKHFMSQFGPALKWPWTKLMDVPELSEDLLNRIEAQSDEQAGGASVRELESVRDKCLVAVLRGLREVPFGAGEVLAQYEFVLNGRGIDPKEK